MKVGRKTTVHLKVDTGFHRLGTDSLEELEEICSFPGIEAEGIFSHLALVNDEENRKQVDKFLAIIAELEKRKIYFKYKHVADSISAVDYPAFRMNMIRPGALVFFRTEGLPQRVYRCETGHILCYKDFPVTLGVKRRRCGV